MSGPTDSFGRSTMNGVRQAIDELNAHGGILGRKATYLLEDDQGQPDRAVQAVEKLSTTAGVDALLGDATTAGALAGAAVAQHAGIPMISPAATSPKITLVGDCIFRTCFDDIYQGQTLARFARGSLKARTAGILRDRGSDYSVGLARYFKEYFEKSGGRVIVEEDYTTADADFKGPLARIKTAGPDVLFVPGYYPEDGRIAHQARDLGIPIPLLGGDGWDASPLLDPGGRDLSNVYYSVHADLYTATPRTQAFVKAYQAKYSERPDAFAALGYDTIYMLADAWRRAGSTEKKKLRAALACTRDFVGVTGRVVMNAQRNPIKAAVVVKFDHGGASGIATGESSGATPSATGGEDATQPMSSPRPTRHGPGHPTPAKAR